MANSSIKTKDLVLKRNYSCKLKHFSTGKILESKLKWVKDATGEHWRTADDGSQISHSWNVIEVSEVTKWKTPKVHFRNPDQLHLSFCNSRAWRDLEFGSIMSELTCEKCIRLVGKILNK